MVQVPVRNVKLGTTFELDIDFTLPILGQLEAKGFSSGKTAFGIAVSAQRHRITPVRILPPGVERQFDPAFIDINYDCSVIQQVNDWLYAKSAHRGVVKTRGSEIIFPYAGCSISMHETVRVPDDGRTFPLPPSLNQFPVYRVSDYQNKLPTPITQQGGIFTAMYQDQAMWLKLNQTRAAAIKLSVGGINAITGRRSDEGEMPLQDDAHGGQNYYCKEQPWVDGICTGDGKHVNQFVMTSSENMEGIDQQMGGSSVNAFSIEVFPEVRNDFMIAVHFPATELWTVYTKVDERTPADYNWQMGATMECTFQGELQDICVNDLLADGVPMEKIFPLQVGLPGIKLLVKNLSGQTIEIHDVDPLTTIADVKVLISNAMNRKHIFTRLVHQGHELQDERRVDSYNIDDGAVLHQLARLPGGCGPENHQMVVGKGGLIAQTIDQDCRPLCYYHRAGAIRVPLCVLNAAACMEVTGLRPQRPSMATADGVSWYRLSVAERAAIAARSDLPFANLTSVRTKNNECCICMTKLSSHRIVPCGHMFCGHCVQQLTTCALCRGQMTAVQRVTAEALTEEMEQQLMVDQNVVFCV
eukprot:TRINITY_DN12971_c0_g1_i1.p1 TRINITY_DN12971_c0_g1~~TRINITY_DN12971_c0_g1_i1.p1  ORF type:complete len:584 (+),score=147.53 TRINITY_DN12971_c0_g1_i1:58-1809(+)